MLREKERLEVTEVDGREGESLKEARGKGLKEKKVKKTKKDEEEKGG